MNVSPRPVTLARWQLKFCAWCRFMQKRAKKGGANALAHELQQWHDRCMSGTVTQTDCNEWYDWVSTRPPQQWQWRALARLLRRAYIAAQRIGDAAGNVLANQSRTPETDPAQIRKLSIARQTDLQYRRDYARYLYQQQRPWDGTISRHTMWTRMAALRVGLKRRIDSALLQLGPAGQDLDQDVRDAAVVTVADALARLDQLEGIAAGPAPGANGSTPPSGGTPTTGRRQRNRKRRGLEPFGDDAEDRVFAAAQRRGLRLDACAAVIVFGLRPCEVARGVRVLWHGDLLIVCARGGKVTARNGQPVRYIAVRAVNAAARYLRAQAIASRGSLVVDAPSAKVLSDTMARAGRTAFPRHDHPPTCYNFRHEFASDLKAEGDPAQTAAAMGHASARSHSGYGTFRRSRRGGRNQIVRAWASRPIRALDRVRPHPGLPRAAGVKRPRKVKP